MSACSKKEEEIILPEIIDIESYSISSTGKTLILTTTDTIKVSTESNGTDLVVYTNYPDYATAKINLLYSPNLNLYSDLINGTNTVLEFEDNYKAIISCDNSAAISNLESNIRLE